MEHAVASVTLYVSRPVHLPPLTAAAAFNTVAEESGLDLMPRGRRDRDSVCRAGGRLALGRYRSVDVEVELVRASGGWCEVGLRPCGRAVPPEGGPKRARYFDRAVPVVVRLAEAMVETVDNWLALGFATDT